MSELVMQQTDWITRRKRRARWFFVLMMVVSGSAILSTSFYAEFAKNGVPTFCPPVLTGLLIFVALWLTIIYRRHIKVVEDLEAAPGRICARCGYSLMELGESGECPECGTPYQRKPLTCHQGVG